MTDRELTGDEAQRALSEAMRRTMATRPVADPTPAELIASLREVIQGVIIQTRGFNEKRQMAWCRSCSRDRRGSEFDSLHDPECAIYKLHGWLDDQFPKLQGLLTVLERTPHEETADPDDDPATSALLASMDALYPLPDDAKRTERAGRTAFVLKRWMTEKHAELEAAITSVMARVRLAAPVPLPDAAPSLEDYELRIDLLRCVWRELEADASEAADGLGNLILALAAEWHVDLLPLPPSASPAAKEPR